MLFIGAHLWSQFIHESKSQFIYMDVNSSRELCTTEHHARSAWSKGGYSTSWYYNTIVKLWSLPLLFTPSCGATCNDLAIRSTHWDIGEQIRIHGQICIFSIYSALTPWSSLAPCYSIYLPACFNYKFSRGHSNCHKFSRPRLCELRKWMAPHKGCTGTPLPLTGDRWAELPSNENWTRIGRTVMSSR